MINSRFRIVGSLMLCMLAAGAAPRSAPISFRVVSSMGGYQTPWGLLEGSPGVFYGYATLGGTAQQAAFSVTTAGVITAYPAFPNSHDFLSLFVGGPNGRFYSSNAYGTASSNLVSVKGTPQSQKVYAAQPVTGPSFYQSLPDGTLLGYGLRNATWSLVTATVQGTVTPFYQFPVNVQPLSLLLASDGNYYGIAATATSPVSHVYRVTPSGSGSTLYTFPPGSFGAFVTAPLLQGSDGNLYGSLPLGGANHTGQIFKLTLGGQHTALYTFPPATVGGPPTTLIQASDNKLYGAAVNSSNQSYLYRVSTSGKYELLYTMSPNDGGCGCNLIQGSDGTIYGIAPIGGSQSSGTVFALNAGLPKPTPQAPKFTPRAGSVGTQVRIWGYNLLSAAVQFNGVAATAASSRGPQYVLATVPTGATTGPITVVTPGGSYTTKASFTVQ